MGALTNHAQSSAPHDWSGLQAAFRSVRRWLGWLALVAAGAFLTWKVARFESTGWLALDFKLSAAQRLVDGETLYPAGTSGEYPYPPLWAMLASPFLLLPTIVAEYLACALCAAAIVAALWIVNVRDPLCFAVALVSGPVVAGTRIGNVSALVTLLLALGYRYNSSPIGLAIAIKLYAWPVLVWSAVRRGPRDLVLGTGVGAAAIVVPWAAIGFDGFERYMSVAREVASTQPTYALPTPISIVVTVLALGAMLARRRDQVGSFAFAILAMLAASPVLWGFYFTAVLLPLALRRPRFSLAWLVPFLAVAVQDHGYAYVFLGLLVWCGLGAPSPGEMLRIGHRRAYATARVSADDPISGPGA